MIDDRTTYGVGTMTRYLLSSYMQLTSIRRILLPLPIPHFPDPRLNLCSYSGVCCRKSVIEVTLSIRDF